MALTQLDQHAALIIIDLQKGIVSLPLAHSARDIVTKSDTLAKVCRQKNISVVIVNVTGFAKGRNDMGEHSTPPNDWANLVPELTVESQDKLISKQTWGAFTNTDLDQYLKQNNITQLFICGIATSMGVESTARFASELGYNVVLITDVMSDMNENSHDNSIKNIFPKLGETVKYEEFLTLLNH